MWKYLIGDKLNDQHTLTEFKWALHSKSDNQWLPEAITFAQPVIWSLFYEMQQTH